jgi:hypothetical protein
VLRTKRNFRRGSRPRLVTRPHLENLETRCLLSAYTLFGETLDSSANLGSLDAGGRASAAAVIGAGPAGAADVYWYRFHLNGTQQVHLSVLTGEIGSRLVGAVSLFNDAPYDPFGPADYYTPTGWRMVAQDDAGNHPGVARIDRLLGEGEYWVAVSGSGNDYFTQTLADTGLDGSTGAFQLSLTTNDPGPAYSDPDVPVVLASDPSPGDVLAQSPFVLRFDLNTPVDPGSITTDFGDPGATAQLWFSATNDFAGGATQVDLSSATVALQPAANELLITPSAPLPAGYYRATLLGYGPDGTDYVVPFRIQGIAGNTDPTKQAGVTPGSAYDIAGAEDGRLHQLAGAIGNDPTDPVPWDQNAQQYYHFSVTGPGPYALGAEVFAGRIGSPLQPVLTLFKADANGNLVFVADNAGTHNGTLDTDNFMPLYTDPALFVSVTRGEYYLAVSTGQNFYDPVDPTGTDPFDPATPDSGCGGNSTGPFVLNVLLQRPGPAPHVVAVTPDTGPTGTGPLAGLHVRFDQPVNLLAVAFQAFLESQWHDGTLSSVRLFGPNNIAPALRLESYDDATNTASFVLLSAVPAGDYTFVLFGDGPEGIASATGTPLAGNGGDVFVTHFLVSGDASPRSTFTSQPGNDDLAHAQLVGVLYPMQVSQGVTFTRGSTPHATDTEDDYSITVLQSRLYSVNISGTSPPAGLALSFVDPTGKVIESFVYHRGQQPMPFLLNAGPYVLRVSWSGAARPYTVRISYSGSPENPTPLVIGSGPALRVRLLTNSADAAGLPVATAPTGGSTPAPVTSAASDGALPGAFTLPSSGLLAQAISPLGGVSAAGGTDSSVSGPLLVRAPAAPDAGTALLSVVIVTQAPLDAPPDAEPPALSGGGATAGQANPAAPMISRLLDLLFEYWNQFSAPLAPQEGSEPSPPAPECGGDGSDDGLGAARPNRAPDGPDTLADSSWGWACALAAGALLSPERGRRGRRGRDGRLRVIDAAFSGMR